MKKIFTILCAGILSLGLSAQTESGNSTIGVNSNLGFSSTDGESDWNLNVSGGYFVMDNLALMAEFGAESATEVDLLTGDIEDAVATSFGIGARYYMGSMFGNILYRIPGEDQSELDLGVGYFHMLTDNISVQPSLSYIMDMAEVPEGFDSPPATIALKVGFGLYF